MGGWDKRSASSALLALALLVSATLAAACGSERRATRAKAGAATGLDGAWRSAGYGLLLEFRGSSLRISQLTHGSCMRVAEARRADRARGPARRYVIDGERSLPVLDVDSGLIEILPGDRPAARRLHVDGAISDIVLERVKKAPSACGRSVGKGPVQSFRVFWRTFREHYPFFARRGVNWSASRRAARAKLGAGTSRRRLFRILVGMIEPLGDAHTWIEAPGVEDGEFDGERPDPQPLGPRRLRLAEKNAERYLQTRLRTFARGQVSVGRLPGSIGYLRITSFSEYARQRGIGAQVRALDRALDAVLGERPKGLVIDIRINDGGSDVLGIAIASRLTDRPYVAYEKIAKDVRDPRGFTPPQAAWVRPGKGPIFTGPVALLTSRYSVSAAETFAQALIGRTPRVTRIGERTQGVFSDVLIRALPNGFRFGLPNEVYLTGGRSFEGRGVPPTIDTGLVFERADLARGRDPEIRKALEVLR